MELKEFANKISNQAKFLDIELTKIQIEKLYKYMKILLEWNEKINLTAITDEDEIIQKHFIDSFTILKYIKSGEKVIDVGTGAGFPGIPLKIIKNDIDITLLDSLNKRINFLKVIIEELELKNVEAVHSRVEEFGKNSKYRESFDIAVSRAVANLATLTEYMIPLVKVQGKCICMKGSNIEEEIQNSKKAIDVLDGKINSIDEFCLPCSDIKRNIILIDKKSKTPAKFPRKPGVPAKEPIC